MAIDGNWLIHGCVRTDEAFDEIFERVARDVEHITRRMERAESGSFLEDYYRSVKDSEPASSEGRQHASSERKLS